MALQDVECGLCGLTLGLGIPGKRRWCSECGEYVVSKAEQADFGSALGAGIAVGVGLVAAYALIRAISPRK